MTQFNFAPPPPNAVRASQFSVLRRLVYGVFWAIGALVGVMIVRQILS